jgi:hypothetical protein
MAATADAFSVPCVGLARVSECWTYGSGVICVRPAEPEAGAVAVVTVISVPTPNSAPSTLPCALRTPDDTAITVITRPIPSSRLSRARARAGPGRERVGEMTGATPTNSATQSIWSTRRAADSPST